MSCLTKGFLMKKLAVLIILCLFASVAWAKEQYVIDVLYITLRDSPMEDATVLRALKSGTKLEVLELGENGYSHVRTEKGEEGWAKTKYLSDEPVAIIRVERLQAKNDSLMAEMKALKEKSSLAKRKVKEAEKERKRLESKSQKLQSQNAKMKSMSAKPMELAKENEALASKNASMESELKELREEKDLNFNSKSRDWFIAGAGVLILGMVIGLILPSIRWRKRNSW